MLKKDCSVFDYGSGCGNDLAYLMNRGFLAYGYEPVPMLAKQSMLMHPELAGRICTSITELPEQAPHKFDAVLCSAVLQHVEEHNLTNCIDTLKGLLHSQGKLCISVPYDTEIINQRDFKNRLFIIREPHTYVQLFAVHGFSLTSQEIYEDTYGRPHRKWMSFIFDCTRTRH